MYVVYRHYKLAPLSEFFPLKGNGNWSADRRFAKTLYRCVVNRSLLGVCFFLAERAGLRCVVASSSAYLPLAPNEFFMGDAKVPNSLLFKDSPGLDEENRFSTPRTVRR